MYQIFYVPVHAHMGKEAIMYQQLHKINGEKICHINFFRGILGKFG